ncbi:MAG TPA: hypothetical protein VLT16_02565 [Candidatus Limnocylindrales bacterium]|nr:hypothetical protein [Candidatus Limnocylindrales bacterium]
MSGWSAERVAKAGIAVQLLVLIRLPAEYFRLKYVHGHALTLAMVEPFIRGELIAALFTAVAVGFFFAGRHKVAVWVAAAMVATLLAYKIFLMG